MIPEIIEKYYSNHIKFVKDLPNGETKRKAIGALVCDIGEKCINTVAKLLKMSWRYVKKCDLCNSRSEYKKAQV